MLSLPCRRPSRRRDSAAAPRSWPSRWRRPPTAPPPGAPAATAGGPWTIDDILLEESAGSFEVSPDGRWVVWVKTRMDKDEGRGRLEPGPEPPGRTTRRDRADPRAGPSHRPAVVSGREADRVPEHPRSGPGKDDDGGRRRKGPRAKTQLWLIDARGGEPWPLTRLDRTIKSFDWRDEGSLVVAVAETKSLREQRAAEDEDTSEVVEVAEETSPARLFAVRHRRRGRDTPHPERRLDRVGEGVARRAVGGGPARAVPELHVRPEDATAPEAARPRERRPRAPSSRASGC